MRSKTIFGALLVSVALCSQGFGFELLDRMLGLNGGGCGECNACAKVAPCCSRVCEDLCSEAACCEKATCWHAAREVCRPTPVRDLFANIKDLFEAKGCQCEPGLLRSRRAAAPNRLAVRSRSAATRFAAARSLAAKSLAAVRSPAARRPAVRSPAVSRLAARRSASRSATSCIAARSSSCSRTCSACDECCGESCCEAGCGCGGTTVPRQGPRTRRPGQGPGARRLRRRRWLPKPDPSASNADAAASTKPRVAWPATRIES